MNRSYEAPPGVLFALIACMALTVLPLQAHMRLDYPPPRTSGDPGVQQNIDDGYLYTSPPCGDNSLIPVGAPTASFSAGSNVVMITDILQTHGGQKLQLFVSYDDVTFIELEAATEILPNSIPYPAGGLVSPPTGKTRLAVRLPDQAAQRATLRAWDNYAFFMCADVELLTNGTDDVFLDGFESK